MFKLLFYLFASFASSDFTEKRAPKGSVFPWLWGLAALKKYKMSFLGVQSNPEDLALDKIATEVALNFIPETNITYILWNNLGMLTKPEKYNDSDIISAELLGSMDHNLDKFEKLFGNLNVEEYLSRASIDTAIGSIWSYMNSTFTILGFFVVAFLMYAIQIVGCFFCFKPIDHALPGIKMRFCILCAFTLILFSSIFMLLGVVSLNNIQDVVKRLDTEIIKDISQTLYDDLNKIFSTDKNAPGSVYSIFKGPIDLLGSSILNLITMIDKHKNKIAEYESETNDVVQRFNTSVKEVYDQVVNINGQLALVTDYEGQPLDITFELDGLYKQIDNTYDSLQKFSAKIGDYKKFVETSTDALEELLETFLNLKNTKVKRIMDTLKDWSSGEKRRYDSGFRYAIQVYEDKFFTIRALYILFAIILMISIGFYYFCWGGFCQASRCCSDTSAIYPCVWSWIIFLAAFFTTFVGAFTMDMGQYAETHLDNALKSVVKEFVPNNQVVFPKIYLGPYTEYLINDTIDVTWTVNPDYLDLFYKLNIAARPSGLSIFMSIDKAFNIENLANLFAIELGRVAENFELSGKSAALFEEAINVFENAKNLPETIDGYLSKGLTGIDLQIDNSIRELGVPIDGSPSDLAKQNIKILVEKLPFLRGNYVNLRQALVEAAATHLNDTKNEVEQSIKGIIREVADDLTDENEGLIAIYQLINSVRIDTILKYYHALWNPLKYDIPYLASSVSMSAHMVLPGFFVLVIIMWVHRKDQLPRNFRIRQFKYTDDEDESTESGHVIVKKRENGSSSLGEEEEEEEEEAFESAEQRNDKKFEDSRNESVANPNNNESDNSSETMSDSEEPPQTNTNLEL